MKDESIDYAYALSLSEEFNRLIEGNGRVRLLFVYKGWDILQSYQAALFGDCKIWSETKSVSALRPPMTASLIFKIFLNMLFVVGISLLSATSALISRKKTLVFSGDKVDGPYKNDFRLNALYQSLNETKTSFIEVVHTLANKETRRHFITRKRFVIYQEAIDMCLIPFLWFKRKEVDCVIESVDFTNTPRADVEFLKEELRKYVAAIPITRVRIKIWKFFLKWLRVRCILSIDDTRHYNEIMAAAREVGIPSYAIQHGHFTKYHTGWLKKTNTGGQVMRPLKLLVWSQYWRLELIRLGTYFRQEEVVVGGARTLLLPTPIERQEIISILIPYEKDAPKKEVRTYIEKFLTIPYVEVIFKLRADQDKQEQLEEYDLVSIASKITIVRSIGEVLPRIRVAAGTYSTFLYDMVALERPVMLLESSIDYGEGMVRNGLAQFLRKTDDVEKALSDVLAISADELQRRGKILVDSDSRTMENALKHIIKKHV